MVAEHLDTGRDGEDAAEAFLASKGFVIIERNYRYGHGEIDIIARDGDYTVFVEVKSRSNNRFGAPEYSITPGSSVNCAGRRRYMYEHGFSELACRFDVVAVEFRNGSAACRHLVNAFTQM
ncbi:MAG: YraN family protein [Ignavibacteria bacterium]|nr:YraN family protein [Ignavibacteria bacterium]